jgi:hypothetical protein
MYPITRSRRAGLAALALAPTLAFANPFAEASPHLDLDGSFIAFMDFDGDGAEIGAKLNTLYEQVLAANPTMPPIPLDFPSVFETLGFGSVKSIAMSSKEIGDGLVRNRAVTILDGEPTGLIGLYGLTPIKFTAAQWAPANATSVFSGTLKVNALRDTLVTLATQIMGPMGQGMAQQYLGAPVPGTDVTANELIEVLSGPMDLVMLQGFTPEMQPDFKVWLSIKGAGSLLARLQPLGGMMPIEFRESELGLEADASALLTDAPFGLILQAPAGRDELVIFTDRDWAQSIGARGDRLADQPAFQRVASKLPAEAAMYSYSAGFDLAPILAILQQNPEAAPFLPLLESAIDLLLGDFIAPNASALHREGDALVTVQYAGYSYKQIVTILPAAVAGAVAGTAIPAYQKVQQTSQEKAVTNNLRQFASAAQQYMLEEGVSEVTYDDIVGPGKYIPTLSSVTGEDYEDLVVTSDSTELSIVLPDGRVVSFQF